MNGTTDLAKVAAEYAVKTMADIPGQVATEAARNTNWTLVAVSVVAALGLLLATRHWLRHRGSKKQPSTIDMMADISTRSTIN